MIGKSFLLRRRAFSLSSKSRLSTPAMSPPGTACFDIFSPAPGDSEVISQVERLSSNDTKIAPRSVRIAADMSGRGMMRCMIVSEVRVEATSLCLGAGRYPFPMGSQPDRDGLQQAQGVPAQDRRADPAQPSPPNRPLRTSPQAFDPVAGRAEIR